MMISPILLSALLVAQAAQAAPAASAPVPAPQVLTLTCPIGGGSFRFSPVSPSPALGERPDGRPYGKLKLPHPLPECPDNGLVLYKEYESAEVAKLEPLVASEAYQALRKSDTQYYRAYWLMREMGEAPERHLWALLQASWEADSKPELRQRYLAELAEASAKVKARADLNWIGMEGRAINALRELGRFDEASARLQKVPLASLESTGTGPEARVRKGWLTFFRSLKSAIDRKDASLEPFEMLPRSAALGRCIDQGAKIEEAAKAFCERESAAVEALRSDRAKIAAEEAALSRSREASGR